ncbi:unnamed protein product, partial [Iphiclides podalirius]
MSRSSSNGKVIAGVPTVFIIEMEAAGLYYTASPPRDLDPLSPKFDQRYDRDAYVLRIATAQVRIRKANRCAIQAVPNSSKADDLCK